MLSNLKRLSCLFDPICIAPNRLCIVFHLRRSNSLSMGDFDKCHIGIGIFIDLDAILGLIFHYFALYAHLSPIKLVLTCLGFFILDLHISSQVI